MKPGPSRVHWEDMLPFLTAPQSAAACAGMLALGASSFRVLVPDVARTRAARVAAVSVVAIAALAHVAWVASPTYPGSYWGAVVALVLLVLLPMVVASVPVAAVMRSLAKRALRARGESASGPTLGRRAVLAAATSFAPAVALGTGISGFVSGAAPPKMPRVRLEYDGLPVGLVGLRVLHLSDLHLGVERHVEDLEEALDRLRGDVPDLIVFTGDVADVVGELDAALSAAVALSPRLGVYASLGNHEYLHDVQRARDVYRHRDDVRLLVGEGERIRVGGVDLWVAGADDPVQVHLDPTPFLDRTIAAAVRDAPPDAFRLLLSHRPEGLVPAARRKVDLVLSGHTHGGQIGFNGKSAFEPIWNGRYLWGPYARGRTRLYTTSGFGHWFPFRLGCPSEAPIIELARAPSRVG